MKVTIKDSNYLSKIEPEKVLNYLNILEFTLVGKHEIYDADVFQSPYNHDSHVQYEVIVMYDTAHKFYAPNMASTLLSLEFVTKESQLQIYSNLTGQEIHIQPMVDCDTIDTEINI